MKRRLPSLALSRLGRLAEWLLHANSGRSITMHCGDSLSPPFVIFMKR
jgi:hypothetical protein